mmetsp:Transcript_18457/g.40182  ORF Transcript_18457/g.40182 Transcript_18457/m.40182 type:complete len:481 (-) Transcript_18457:30-1472(-)
MSRQCTLQEERYDTMDQRTLRSSRRRAGIRGESSGRVVRTHHQQQQHDPNYDISFGGDDVSPLIASTNDAAPLPVYRSNRANYSRYRQSSLRPMNVASSSSAALPPSVTATRYDSESSEDAPLLSHSLMDSSTYLGVEDAAYPRSNHRGVSHRRRRANAGNAWDQAGRGAGGTVIKNSNPVTNVGCCHSGCCCIQCVRTGEVGLLQTFGRFDRMLKPGLVCMCWPCTRVGRLSLRVQQIDLVIETKTLDAVFVTIGLALQYKVVKIDAWNAYYRLTDPSKQIEAVVFDVVRSTVPRMELDEVFASKSDIATEIQRKIEYIHQFGYEIVDTLLTSISPVAVVKDSMNAMNSAKRSKDAMPHRAEGEKIAKVKSAEAAAEKAHLNGVGVAKARTAIASSLKESLHKLDIKESGIIAPKNVMDLLLISQYYDTLSALGAESVILHHNPQEIGELEAQISTYFAETQAAAAQLPDHGLIPDLLS